MRLFLLPIDADALELVHELKLSIRDCEAIEWAVRRRNRARILRGDVVQIARNDVERFRIDPAAEPVVIIRDAAYRGAFDSRGRYRSRRPITIYTVRAGDQVHELGTGLMVAEAFARRKYPGRPIIREWEERA